MASDIKEVSRIGGGWILAAMLAALHFATTSSSWQPWGASDTVVANVVLALAICAAVGTVVLSLIGLTARPTRAVSARRLLVGLLALTMFALEVFLYGSAREAGIRGVVAQGNEVVAAIDRFEREHGRLPITLDDLVPTYLPKVPSTGAAISPEFWFTSDGRHYSSSVGVGQWVLDFSYLGYNSRQSYDDRDIRYGAWALHLD